MDTESLLRESRAETLVKTLEFSTEIGKTQFQSQVRKLSSNIGVLKRRQETILAVRKSLTDTQIQEMDTIFQKIQELEPDLKVFFETTDVEKDSYQQLLFSGWSSFQVLNTIPFVLLGLAIFKQYIVPALAVLTPLFMVIMPYVFLKFWYGLPISTEQYIKILMNMFGLQSLDLTNPRTLLQGSLTMFSIGQSIYQPIQNAIHLQTIHAQLLKKAEAAEQIVVLLDDLLQKLPPTYRFKNPLQDLDLQDKHRLFATFWDHPYRLKLALQCVGDCEVIYRFAKYSRAVPVHWRATTTPSLHISKGMDPFLETAIPYSLKLAGSSHHAVLTGPNRGGKSSVLRTTLLNIVIAQTFGVGFVDEGGFIELRPFDWIATGLRLEDKPGSTSMFESEVDFALLILQRAKENPNQVGFVVFDELFHSTNPPDGSRTADLFLQRLWKTPNTASFISTHVFDLAKKAHKHIQKLCVPAHQKENGDLHFTYTLQEGVCEVSSVDLILKEKGLLS